jgi:hypothetical protein
MCVPFNTVKCYLLKVFVVELFLYMLVNGLMAEQHDNCDVSYFVISLPYLCSKPCHSVYTKRSVSIIQSSVLMQMLKSMIPCS